MIVVGLSSGQPRFSGHARDESSAFHGVECVRRRRDAQHVTLAIARTHQPGVFVASAVQEDVPQLVPEAAAEEPGDQEFGERLGARARD